MPQRKFSLKPRITAIIQARIQSKRLPAKSLQPLMGKPLLAHVIERAKLIENVDTVVLATVRDDENAPLVELARSLGIEVFRGSPSNVLERYYQAAEEFGGDFIVRVTGDNPFTDVDYASLTVDYAMEVKPDLCAPINLPLGTAVEVIRREALEEAYNQSHEPYHFEHVTPYIKEHPEFFSIERPPVNFNNPYPQLRLTVDTPEDYQLARNIYDALYKGKPFSIAEVLEYLTTNPTLMEINSSIRQRTMRESEEGDET